MNIEMAKIKTVKLESIPQDINVGDTVTDIENTFNY